MTLCCSPLVIQSFVKKSTLKPEAKVFVGPALGLALYI